jgi:uncharacterized membrane protein YkoI
MNALPLLLVVSVFFAFGLPHMAAAQRTHDSVKELVESGKLRPLSEVLQVVRSRYRGRVLDVDLDRGRLEYRVKVLTKGGDMMFILVDGRTARVISVRGGGPSRRRRGR